MREQKWLLVAVMAFFAAVVVAEETAETPAEVVAEVSEEIAEEVAAVAETVVDEGALRQLSRLPKFPIMVRQSCSKKRARYH